MRITLYLLPIVLVLISARVNAASIVNMDEVPHSFIIDVLGQQREISLMPWRKIEVDSTPARVILEDSVSEVLEPTGHYAIWPGPIFSLQGKGGASRDRF